MRSNPAEYSLIAPSPLCAALATLARQPGGNKPMVAN
jgi:hypothetical protein